MSGGRVANEYVCYPTFPFRTGYKKNRELQLSVSEALDKPVLQNKEAHDCSWASSLSFCSTFEIVEISDTKRKAKTLFMYVNSLIYF